VQLAPPAREQGVVDRVAHQGVREAEPSRSVVVEQPGREGRVERLVERLRELTHFDHLYVGGGNGHRLTVDLGPKATIVSNTAGILGGIKLWERHE
jgi:hypothetical protein